MKFAVVLLFCTIMVLLKTRPGEAHSRRIVAGQLVQQADRQKMSFLVSLKYHKPNHVTAKSGFPHVCQGTLVNVRWIVTAAHCFSALTLEGVQNLADWTAVAGEYDLGGTEGVEQTRTIIEIIPHPNFNMTQFTVQGFPDPFYKPFWDLALLKVDRPFNLNQHVSTLGYDSYCVKPGDDCFIYGWGAPAYGGAGRRFPYEGALQMPARNKCHVAFDHHNPIIAAGPVFCAQGTTANENGLVTDGCQADSGGPFVCKCEGQDRWPILTGIMSFGILCGYPGLPGVYTDLTVQEMRDFIFNNIP